MIRFAAYPKAEAPPEWMAKIVDVFGRHEDRIGTGPRKRGLTSDEVLAILAPDLEAIGFRIEKQKLTGRKGDQSVLSGEAYSASGRFRFDVYHPEWLCCLAIEASRSATFTTEFWDIVEPQLVMSADSMCLAVPKVLRRRSGGEEKVRRDFDQACSLADSVYGHVRFGLPKRLLLIGY